MVSGCLGSGALGLGFRVWGLDLFGAGPESECQKIEHAMPKQSSQGQFQVDSYQVGTLKGGLYRPHIAPLPLYEP